MAKETQQGLKKSLFGASGIEIAFPLLYTYLVKTKIITLDKLLELLVTNPAKRFGYQPVGDFSVWDLEKEAVIDNAKFISKGKNTPFQGYNVFGVNYLTIHDEKVVYKR